MNTFLNKYKNVLLGILYIFLLIEILSQPKIIVVFITIGLICLKYIYLGIRTKSYIFFGLVFAIFMQTYDLGFRMIYFINHIDDPFYISEKELPLLFVIITAISIYCLITFVLMNIIFLIKDKKINIYNLITQIRIIIGILIVDFMITSVTFTTGSLNRFMFEYKKNLIELIFIYYVCEYLFDIINLGKEKTIKLSKRNNK